MKLVPKDSLLLLILLLLRCTLPLHLRPQAQRHRPNSFLIAVDVQQQFTAYRLGFLYFPGAFATARLQSEL